MADKTAPTPRASKSDTALNESVKTHKAKCWCADCTALTRRINTRIIGKR